MKKVVLALAVIATAACFTSCDKTCTCKTFVNDDVKATVEVELDDDSDMKCSDMNTIATIGGKKNGIECK